MSMKTKIQNWLLVLLCIVIFSSCGDDDDATPENDQQGNTSNELAGTISEDRVLSKQTDDPDGIDYIMTGDVIIEAKLTIEPGVRVAVENDLIMTVASSGTFVAEGEEDNMILFTAANLEAGDRWKGLRFQSSDERNKLEYVRIEYAGSSPMRLGSNSNYDYPANVGIYGDAVVSILHCEIALSEGYGVFLRGDNPELKEYGSNIFEDNSEAAISIQARNIHMMDEATTYMGNGYNGVEINHDAHTSTYGGNVVSTESTWGKLHDNTEYLVRGEINIEAPLFIEPGVILAMDEDVLVSVNDSYISAEGTAGEKVIFTTANPEAGQHWQGLRISSSDQRNKLDHVIIEYAGNSDMILRPNSFYYTPTNLGVDNDGAYVNISNSTVSNSKGYGITVHEDGSIDTDNVDIHDNAEGGSQVYIQTGNN